MLIVSTIASQDVTDRDKVKIKCITTQERQRQRANALMLLFPIKNPFHQVCANVTYLTYINPLKH